jgi:hypothetical protein
MTKLLHGSLQHKALDERLRAAGHDSVALAYQIDELLELRDAVRTAELATVRKKRSSKNFPRPTWQTIHADPLVGGTK